VDESTAAIFAKVVSWRKERRHRRRREKLEEILRDRERLIRKLVTKAARQEKSQEPLEDLLQAGAIGMARALEDWDPARGALSTHAAWWIKHHVQLATRTGRPIKLPRIRADQATRDRVLREIRANPELTAEGAGVEPNVFRDLKQSFGLRFLSTAEERGSRALERWGTIDSPEEQYEQAERMQAVDALVARYSPGATAESMGLDRDVFDLLLDVVKDRTERIDSAHEEPMKAPNEMAAMVADGPKTKEELTAAGATRASIENALTAGVIAKGRKGKAVIFALPGVLPAAAKKTKRRPATKRTAPVGPGIAKTQANPIDAAFADLRARAEEADRALAALPAEIRALVVAKYAA